MKKVGALLLLSSALLSACSFENSNVKTVKQVLEKPQFENTSVHDPSVWLDGNEKYIIGSHLQFAKSKDLMKWETLSESVASSQLFEDVFKEFEEEFSYARTTTFWASDIIQLEDGRYYLYYCLCEGSSPLSVLGLAVSDDIEGPYEKVESFLTSGRGRSPDGQPYNATIHPNAIDPHVFYDEAGELWMVYGSYSGGIFILPLDKMTGLPTEETYGTKLLGGNHARIEAPYILYNQETMFYYLFTSFGGLDADGSYNIRVARSKNPDGPYEDMNNQDMIDAKGEDGTIFDDISIAPYGTKVLGNYLWQYSENEEYGYVSPGHNSAYYDEELDRYFILFHTRFPQSGEMHEVRVHALLFNADGWPVIAPRRYAGEKIETVSYGDVQGDYLIIEDQNAIVPEAIVSQGLTVTDNKISGDYSGIVELGEQGLATVQLNGETVNGHFLLQWDEYTEKQTMTFTGLTPEGKAFMMVRK